MDISANTWWASPKYQWDYAKRVVESRGSSSKRKNDQIKQKFAVAGDRTRVTRVTGGNTHHYTTTTWMLTSFFKLKGKYCISLLYAMSPNPNWTGISTHIIHIFYKIIIMSIHNKLPQIKNEFFLTTKSNLGKFLIGQNGWKMFYF